jgi:hypothetical protein
MSFASDLKEWRGTRCQKQVNDIFGVSLGTYQSWEEEKNKPTELGMRQIYFIMAADKAGVPVNVFMQNYMSVIRKVAAEIQNRK